MVRLRPSTSREIQDGAPEIHATRRSDGKTLVIEHTLIQPFDAHKQEFARLQGLRSIEQDQSLVVPDVRLLSISLLEFCRGETTGGS